jgi:hypothetical protein
MSGKAGGRRVYRLDIKRDPNEPVQLWTTGFELLTFHFQEKKSWMRQRPSQQNIGEKIMDEAKNF